MNAISEKLITLEEVTNALSDHSNRIKSLEDDKKILAANVKDLANRVDIYDQNSLASSIEIACVPSLGDECIPVKYYVKYFQKIKSKSDQR